MIELFLISFGVSMDAFAVSVSKGLTAKKFHFKTALIVALFFGTFQAGMPLLGYLLGMQFQEYIDSFAHWLAFILLTMIGLNIIRESKKESADTGEKDCQSHSPLSLKRLSVLAFSTSIDALAVGISFAFLEVNIVSSILIIGLITFIMSILGVKIGSVFGTRFRFNTEFVGGLILILIGIHILLENTGVLLF